MRRSYGVTRPNQLTGLNRPLRFVRRFPLALKRGKGLDPVRVLMCTDFCSLGEERSELPTIN